MASADKCCNVTYHSLADIDNSFVEHCNETSFDGSCIYVVIVLQDSDKVLSSNIINNLLIVNLDGDSHVLILCIYSDAVHVNNQHLTLVLQ